MVPRPNAPRAIQLLGVPAAASPATRTATPRIGLPPEAVDYFHQATAERHSWRAMHNLALVTGGRCVVALGLAGVSEAFARGGLNAHAPHRGSFHPTVFILGCVGAAVGLGLHVWGVLRFYQDTAQLNRQRAVVVGVAGVLGAVLVTGGGTLYAWGMVHHRSHVVWETLPIRSVGNALVFACIPNSFAASEMVHGNVPIRHRLIARDGAFALGGMFLMAWAQIASPCPPGPLWSRELAQCAGIMGIAIGGALPRSDSNRAQAATRQAHRQLTALTPSPL